MKSLVSFTALAPLTLLGSALFPVQTVAQTAVPEQALRELNIMRNIFNAAMEDNRNRRFRIDGPEALYLAGQGMVFTFDMPGGNSLFSMMGEDFRVFADGDFDFDFEFDYDDEGPVTISNAPQPPQAPQAAQAARVAQVAAQAEAIASYRSQLEEFNEQMRDKQDAMRALQRSMREQQRAQQRAQQANDAADFDDTEMDKLSDEMEKIGDDINSISNNMNQIRQEYESERNAAVAALHQQQTTVIFDTLCNYGNTMRSLQNGEHVNLVLRNREDDSSQVYVVDYAKLANCSSGSALQQSVTSYAMPERNGF